MEDKSVVIHEKTGDIGIVNWGDGTDGSVDITDKSVTLYITRDMLEVAGRKWRSGWDYVGTF